MGKQQSILAKSGYAVEETEVVVIATKGDEKFIIKQFPLDEVLTNAELISKIQILHISNPHIVSSKNSFRDPEMYYVVTDYCQGGNLAAKIKERDEPAEECEVLSWISEICVALKAIHEKSLFQKNLTPEDIHFTEFGILCLDGYQKIYEKSKFVQSTTDKNTNKMETSYLAPEVYTEGIYNDKSDIWSVGCILYELCTQQPAFSSESTIEIIPKIIGGPYPTLPEEFSPELCQLLDDIFHKNPQLRPTASEILGHPFIINCLLEKTKTTVDGIQTKLVVLRALADGLERVHQGTTIGSLVGGVIGAVGGITSIVGLILAPFTLGASLIVTGVGVGVGAVGGATAGASNITNMVNQSTDRKAVRTIIKEIEQKIDAVVSWLQEINNSLQTIKSRCEKAEGDDSNSHSLVKIGLRTGKGLAGVAELIRLVQVMNVGRIAAQATRVVRVAEVAAGALSGLFVAVDMFFIAMDAKEIYNIRKAKEKSEGATNEDVPTVDYTKLLADVLGFDTPYLSPDAPIKSELMKFVRAIRQAADNLQEVVDELRSIVSSIPSLEYGRELECQNTNK